ncbi:MAG: TIGR02266 family protein [Deltaproteobacteria bacterium]|nr:TIGR02266 family protein [Deltaproteobacteria bacterium]
MVDESDRRTQGRGEAALRVDYKRLNTFIADYTKNISKGGTFVRTTNALPVGAEIDFVLALPSPDGQEPVELQLRGVVKWIVSASEATAEKPEGMGIQFLFANDDQRRAIEKTVEDIMAAALGPRLADKLLRKG